MSWDIITITASLYGRMNHQVTCQRCGCSFSVGDKAVRQTRRTGNRYYCPSCEQKIRV